MRRHRFMSERAVNSSRKYGVEMGELTVGADYDGLDDAWWSFASGVGTSGAYCTSLDDTRRDALKAAFHCRLGSPHGPFGLTARAWYARGSTPE